MITYATNVPNPYNAVSNPAMIPQIMIANVAKLSIHETPVMNARIGRPMVSA
ncbi:hypothetical protein D3C71_1913950 [compost metagenome]